jgi:hypothetical protein
LRLSRETLRLWLYVKGTVIPVMLSMGAEHTITNRSKRIETTISDYIPPGNGSKKGRFDMKRILDVLKTAALLAAVGIVGTAVAPSDANAKATRIVCDGTGSTCAVIVGDKTTYYKLVQAI